MYVVLSEIFYVVMKKMLQLEIMYEESLFFCRQEHHLLCMLDILLICWAIKKMTIPSEIVSKEQKYKMIVVIVYLPKYRTYIFTIL